MTRIFRLQELIGHKIVETTEGTRAKKGAKPTILPKQTIQDGSYCWSGKIANGREKKK